METEALRGRGAFLLGAHMGSFEALGACKAHASAGKEPLKLAMLMFPDNAVRITEILNAIALPECRPRVISLGGRIRCSNCATGLTQAAWVDCWPTAPCQAPRTSRPVSAEQPGAAVPGFARQFQRWAVLACGAVAPQGVLHGGSRRRRQPLRRASSRWPISASG